MRTSLLSLGAMVTQLPAHFEDPSLLGVFLTVRLYQSVAGPHKQYMSLRIFAHYRKLGG